MFPPWHPDTAETASARSSAVLPRPSHGSGRIGPSRHRSALHAHFQPVETLSRFRHPSTEKAASPAPTPSSRFQHPVAAASASLRNHSALHRVLRSHSALAARASPRPSVRPFAGSPPPPPLGRAPRGFSRPNPQPPGNTQSASPDPTPLAHARARGCQVSMHCLCPLYSGHMLCTLFAVTGLRTESSQ